VFRSKVSRFDSIFRTVRNWWPENADQNRALDRAKLLGK
jgi:hypothetical protein